jgi:peptidoglycan-associated lipoprotein
MSQSIRPVTLILASALCAALHLACANAKPPTTPAGGTNVAMSSPPAQQNAAPSQTTTSDVHISDEIRNKCGISDQDAYFRFNSADVTANDRTPLDLVVKCFTSGPLKGRAVKLIGRADPRGATEYNMTLGQWRADAVDGYLASRGMQKAKVLTTSRGAMDATGSDESSWQHDRRVDVTLAN